MTDTVNVTEKVARALCPSLWDDTYPEHLREGLRPLAREHATAALATLSDPEVLAEIAAALREHDAPAHIDGLPDDEYDCCAVAVVKRLRGQG